MLPEGYAIRRVLKLDYQGYIDTLSGLTTVGNVSESDFETLVAYWDENPIYRPHVIVNLADIVVATGMLLVEKKLIHGCGSVGHIEDILVASSEQGKKLGISIITALTEEAKAAGCYKVILDCSAHNVGFYEKCGYKNDGTEMLFRF